MFNTLKRLVRSALKPPIHGPDTRLPYDLYGEGYCYWPLLREITPDQALVYSFGVGEDISFDLAAIAAFDCKIHAFDPTPRSQSWMDMQDLPSQFSYHPIGIAAIDGLAEFFAPARPDHVSFSQAPDRSAVASGSITAEVMRLQSLIAHLGTRVPDVLKMDIEGFEYEVVDDIVDGDIMPAQFLVEFHHGMYGIAEQRTRQAVEKLRAAGYALYFVAPSGREYGFVRKDRIE